VKGGIIERVKEGYMKHCPKLRKHTLHKIKRK
jgi:ribosomal protein L33